MSGKLTGRLERDLEYQRMTEEICSRYPDYLFAFYYSMNELQKTTVFDYIRYTAYFLDFVQEKFGINADVQSLNKIQPEHINAYKHQKIYNKNGQLKKYSDTYVLARQSALKKFFSFMFLTGYIDQDPMKNVEPVKIHKRSVEASWVSDESVDKIMENIRSGSGSDRACKYQKLTQNRDRLIFAMLLVTGLRISGLMSINVSDVSDIITGKRKGFEAIDKEEHIKTYYLDDKTIDLLKIWLKDRERILGEHQTDALFISLQKRRMTNAAVRAVVKKYTANIPEHVTPHKLRSTFATNLYEATGDIYIVADCLGHSNPQTTQRYAKIKLNAKQHVPEIVSGKINY